MQLLMSPSSPHARKVRIVARELGLSFEEIALNPWSDARLRPQNPLAKVPTLIRDDGTPLYDSAVICDYLDLAAGHPLIPQAGEPRWRALRLQALVTDACIAAGRLFAGEQRGGEDPMRARLTAAIDAGLDTLESEALDPAHPDLGEICAALLPAYCAFRWPEQNWHASRPRLAAFCTRIEERASFLATRHTLLD